MPGAPSTDHRDEDPARHLAAVLDVHGTGADSFVGRCPAQAFGRIYGGQLAAQSLLAAARTVSPDRPPISAHVNFLKLGTIHEPVTYTVERVADGRSLSTRVVHARQQSQLLTVSIISFQDLATEHTRIDHDARVDEVAAPDALISRDASMAEHFGAGITNTMAMSSWPFEVRYIDRTPWMEGSSPPRNRMWLRSIVALPDDQLTHCAALLYAADLHLPEPILFPASLSWYELVNGIGVFGASLDYALWFHRPFRLDQWMLHEQEAPAIANSRGLVTGRFWTPDGRLAASATELVGIFSADGG